MSRRSSPGRPAIALAPLVGQQLEEKAGGASRTSERRHSGARAGVWDEARRPAYNHYVKRPPARNARDVERETGLEPATPYLEGRSVSFLRENASLGWCKTPSEAMLLVLIGQNEGGHTSSTRTCDQYSASSGPSASPSQKVSPSLHTLGSSVAKYGEGFPEFLAVSRAGGSRPAQGDVIAPSWQK
jgi:hypothetical protein